MPTLHVVVPVFNERETLETCLRRVVAAPLPRGWSRDLYIVDDHSADDAFRETQRIVGGLQDDGYAVALRRHDANRGKGVALMTGFDAVLAADPEEEDLVIIQDADLEYDPDDFAALVQAFADERVGAAIGSRWGRHRPLRGLGRRIHAAGNGALTALSNRMTGYRVRDMECCYKVFRPGVLAAVRPQLTEPGFGIEPQMLAALSRLGTPIAQRPVRYRPRGFGDGKKIKWTDGVRAIAVILRERLRGGRAPGPARERTLVEHAS